MTNRHPMPASSSRGRRARAAVVAAALLGPLALGACNDFLDVTNPGAIETPDLENPDYIGLMVNGVIGEFQPTLGQQILYTSVFGDEIRNHHVFSENVLIDQRNVEPDNGTYGILYNALHRSRFLADSISDRLKDLLGDSASRDLRLARTLAYAGQSYVLLGETVCESPINLSAPIPSDELLAMAYPRFDEAIAVATAAKNAAGASERVKLGADSIIYFAKVGAARAALDVNDKAKAVTYATGVPADFEFLAYFSENTSREANPLWNAASTGNAASLWYGVGETYRNLNDPRVPHPDTMERQMDGTDDYAPNSPLAYSTYDGTVDGADFTEGASIRVASGLEARYILAEADGATPATLAFVNERRVAGGQPTTDLSGDALMAELREQRRRDFYLDGHRLGDLRRYLKYYDVDLFPSGPYPGSTTGAVYGDQTCLPLTLSEILNNPNVPKS